MFGIFKAKPPLSAWEQAWTEDRLAWFANQLGMGGLLESDTLHPDHPRLSSVTNQDEAMGLLEFLGERMRVDTSRIRLQVYSEFIEPSAVGSFGERQNDVVLVMEQALFEQRDALIATLARQLAEMLLSSDLFRDVRLSDREWTADLLPVFFGLGIFAANRTLRPPKEEPEHFAWWGIKQRGYLSARIFGYALALRAHVRGEAVAPWSKFLRQDAQAALLDGRNYLEKRGDSVFTADSLSMPRAALAIDTLVEELRSGGPSRKIAAMWELSARAEHQTVDSTSQVGGALMDAIRHKDSEVRAVAASTLPLYDWSIDAAQDISDGLKDSHEEVRISAAGALGKLVGVDDEFVVNNLTDALTDDVRLVVFNAARSLVNFGRAAESATPALLKRLRQSLVECRDRDTQTLLSAINSIARDPRTLLQEFFADDAEFCEFSLEMLEHLIET